MPDLKKLEISPAAAVLISGVLIAGAILFVNLHPTQPVVAADAQQLPASVNVPAPSASDHIVGSPTAPLVLVEYSDFQCPYCAMIYPSLKQIVAESNGQIAWVMRDFPLTSIHPQAQPAALAAECIAAQLGNDGWWKFADTVFNNQSKMNPAYYAQLAAQFGADPTTFATCVSSGQFQNKLDQGTAEAETNGGNGTPFTVVVGKGAQVQISGALPYAQIMAVINAVKARQ